MLAIIWVYILMMAITEVLINKANFIESDSAVVVFSALWPAFLPVTLIYLLIDEFL